MYRMIYMYAMQWLFFHISYAIFIIKYGLLIYGNAQKSDFETIDQAQRCVLKVAFFQREIWQLERYVQTLTKLDSIRDIHQKNFSPKLQ